MVTRDCFGLGLSTSRPANMSSREISTPLPPVGRHTEALEKPATARGRTREMRPRSETRVSRSSREPQSRPEMNDKRSPEVTAPDLKKIKLEQGGKTDVDMPDFGGHKLPTITPGTSACATDQPSEGPRPAENRTSSEKTIAAVPEPLFNTRLLPPPASFDLTADDEDDEADDAEENQETQRDGDDDDELKTAAPHTLTAYNAAPPAPSSRQTGNPAGGVGMYPLSSDAPPWIQELQSGIMGLHNKVDMSRSELAQYGAVIQAQGIRVSHLEAVAQEHTQQLLQAQTQIKHFESRIAELDKIQELEKRISELEAAKRYLTPPRHTGPPSPRSPRSSTGESRDEEGNLDIIIGGWSDAKRSDAQQEVANIFAAIGMPDSYNDLWAPYSRTNFIKVQLVFPDPNAHIKFRRVHQLKVLEQLKAKKFTSGVPGSEGNRIWATKSKTREERERVRALVLTKEFLKNLPGYQNRPSIPEKDIEIVWNGRLFVHHLQLLSSIDRDGEPNANDFIISDARGNHIPWFVRSAQFEELTGYPAAQLADLWEQHCP